MLHVVLKRPIDTIVGESFRELDNRDQKRRPWDAAGHFLQNLHFLFGWLFSVLRLAGTRVGWPCYWLHDLYLSHVVVYHGFNLDIAGSMTAVLVQSALESLQGNTYTGVIGGLSAILSRDKNGSITRSR